MNKISEEETKRQLGFIEELKDVIAEKKKRLNRDLTYHVTTFGCQMNARDSEKLSGILESIGYVPTESEEADFILYNTCTVRENANMKVYGRLGGLKHQKKANPEMIVALCGCMMQEAHVVEKLRTSYPQVDIVFGTHNVFKLAELIKIHFDTDDRVIDVWEKTDEIVEDLPSTRKFKFKTGVNIMFGCNNFCSFCIVPYVRGRERSRDPKDIVREIEGLVADGVVEVMLLGQNVNSYGKNLEEPMSFAELLKEVEKIEGLKRIRFMTSHPKDLSDDLIEVMAHSKKICKHLHLPVQTGSSRLLKDMNRRYTKEDYLALVDKIKKAIPDISLSTDIMVGYPGETDEDNEETMDVVRKAGYDSAYTFIYSIRKGTKAAERPDQIPEDIVKERFDKVLALVQEISVERVKRFEGRVMEVLVEEKNVQLDGYISGRLENNVIVHFPGDPSLIGEMVNVKLTECKGFYYYGELKTDE